MGKITKSVPPPRMRTWLRGILTALIGFLAIRGDFWLGGDPGSPIVARLGGPRLLPNARLKSDSRRFFGFMAIPTVFCRMLAFRCATSRLSAFFAIIARIWNQLDRRRKRTGRSSPLLCTKRLFCVTRCTAAISRAFFYFGKRDSGVNAPENPIPFRFTHRFRKDSCC
jgi:hypothetical protein